MSTISIPLTQGKFAIVDSGDIEMVHDFKWCALRDHHTFYAVTHLPRSSSGRTLLRMHRVIMGVTDSLIGVDHGNGNGLDNRRSNLRSDTGLHNQQNRRAQVGGSSMFKGVYRRVDGPMWHAHIRSEGVRTYLGLFDTEIDAAIAYDDAARELHKWPTLNFPMAHERGALV